MGGGEDAIQEEDKPIQNLKCSEKPREGTGMIGCTLLGISNGSWLNILLLLLLFYDILC